ncbi:AraC family transcriptional regulator ligand-binding domain-containing protein [Novosphingobium sp. KCTC 2891]|uniref:AraC family transcriptional regulator ligand-binding domain-containing protein n=1 Tax=Novosphingobium sp. KCTC 2891 TaxID=2989730 RepID=UPI0022235C9B|nr:AraC family transcriptional regulator ligand-binding domain-containing protein [Novosphingobium sp. KCTC 2891]MCW1384744.1 AraC family transcriptional regulator ligand-binding domain-containing protein [Novosphingobium sp. KCTC 2891]
MENRSGPIAHSSSMQQFVRFARMAGIALETILDREMLDILRSSERSEVVPAQAMVDIMQLCSIVARRPDLGIAFAAWCNLRGYGPLSLLWDHCPTVQESVRISGRFLHLESEALGSSMSEEGDEIALQQYIAIPARFGGSQYLESTLTLQMRTIQLILGEDWHPLRMEFNHPGPASLKFHRGVFRCPVIFGADRSALVLSRADMRRPSPNGNARMLAFLERKLANEARNIDDDIAAQVERIVSADLPGGHATLERTASLLATSPRTLQRRLGDVGESFAAILDRVRRRTADEYFATERKPNLSELAHRLGYAEASAASRFLRTTLRTGSRALARQAFSRTSVRTD